MDHRNPRRIITKKYSPPSSGPISTSPPPPPQAPEPVPLDSIDLGPGEVKGKMVLYQAPQPEPKDYGEVIAGRLQGERLAKFWRIGLKRFGPQTTSSQILRWMVDNLPDED